MRVFVWTRRTVRYLFARRTHHIIIHNKRQNVPRWPCNWRLDKQNVGSTGWQNDAQHTQPIYLINDTMLVFNSDQVHYNHCHRHRHSYYGIQHSRYLYIQKTYFHNTCLEHIIIKTLPKLPYKDEYSNMNNKTVPTGAVNKTI